eukprot:TRINITY_DN1332_c0_g1_i1.p2 TRINITY_DN1332_c0_g1~~TRINITY_DN1332_c0_g1_i1.p2  ORF type:complete len:254 (-),score=78.10 TRINITY_DN1332_c0_g1_i1:64-825(-)
MSQVCCPPGSWPSLQADYTPIGTTQEIATGLTAYVVGSPQGKGILVVPDIFGVDSGRTKAIADQLASNGYFVVLPDVFRGVPYVGEVDMAKLGAWAATFPAPKILEEIAHTLAFFKTKGVEKVGLTGFCWGSWAMFHAVANEKFQPQIVGGVHNHTSVILEAKLFGGDPVALADKALTPQLFLTAGNDPDFAKEGGEISQKLKAKPFGALCGVKDFPNMVHGFVNRGDISKEDVAADVKTALSLGLEFFAKIL